MEVAVRLIAALSIAAVTVASPALAGKVCLDIAKVTNIKHVSEKIMIVSTRSHQAFTVTFRNMCPAGRWSNTFFVYEPWTLQPCLHSGDVLPTNNMGPCFVDTVVPGAQS